MLGDLHIRCKTFAQNSAIRNQAAYLLRKYSTGDVAPFALLSPAVGAVVSALVFGESFGLVRFAGMACMVVGLVIVITPRQRLAFLFRLFGFSLGP